MKFPITVAYRHLEATIYGKSAANPFYRVKWGKGRNAPKKAFKTLKAARKSARSGLKKMHEDGGASDLLVASNREDRKWRLALEALKPLGIGLLEAVQEFAAAKKLAPALNMSEAVRCYLQTNATVQRVSFKALVDEFMATKQKAVQDGDLSARYLKELRLMTTRLSGMFLCDVIDLNREALRLIFSQGDFAKLSSKSRNHYRNALRELFSFAVRHDYLPLSHRLGDALLNERTNEAAPAILTPQQFTGMLCAASEEILPVLLLGGFAGARRAEIERLSWADVWRRPGYVEIEAWQAKTRGRRLVPIQPCLANWLGKFRSASGPVWGKNSRRIDTLMGRLKQDVEADGDNLLRHSYIAYRLAQVKSVGQVALEAGTSEAMIFKHCRELVTEAGAAQWFSITRPAAA